MIGELILLSWLLFPSLVLACLIKYVIQADKSSDDEDAVHEKLAAEKRRHEDER